MIQKIRTFFADHYGHVNLQAMSDSDILDFVKQAYVHDRPFENQMDLLYDNILANQLVEVVE